LIGFNGICRVNTNKPFHYIHLLLPKHSIIEANGIKTESLFLGQNVLADLSRSEMATIRRTLKPSELCAMVPARVNASGKKLKQLLMRHRKNGKQLYQDVQLETLNAA
jgi:hypothetical protein